MAAWFTLLGAGVGAGCSPSPASLLGQHQWLRWSYRRAKAWAWEPAPFYVLRLLFGVPHSFAYSERMG